MTDRLFGPCMLGKTYGGIPAYVVWNGVILFIVMVVFYWLIRGSKGPKETPDDILSRRLASGEISKNEYLELKKELAE